MMIRRILTAIALLAFVSTPVFAEATTPTPTAPAPKAAPKKAAPKAPAAVTEKVNLNTATAPELDKLPQIGKARVKAIIDARTKMPFKDWGDFVARKVVPANAQKAIKDLVVF